jgi:hypothetical protein
LPDLTGEPDLADRFHSVRSKSRPVCRTPTSPICIPRCGSKISS